MSTRMCYICGALIHECMGSVHAGSFVKAVKAVEEGRTPPPVDELCPYCATYYANTTPEINPYPSPVEGSSPGCYALP